MFAITVGLEVMLPFELFRLLITCALFDFLILITNLSPIKINKRLTIVSLKLLMKLISNAHHCLNFTIDPWFVPELEVEHPPKVAKTFKYFQILKTIPKHTLTYRV